MLKKTLLCQKAQGNIKSIKLYRQLNRFGLRDDHFTPKIQLKAL